MPDPIIQQPAEQTVTPASVGVSQSPLERHLEQAEGLDPVPGNLDADELAQAREKDLESNRAKAAKDEPVEEDVETPEPKPEEPPKPAPQKPEPEPRSPARKADWALLKSERDNARAEATSLKTQLEGLKKSTASVDSAALTKELAQYKEIVKGLAIERDPEFVAKFDRAKQSAISAAKIAAGSKGSELASILAMPAGNDFDTKLDEFLGELSPSARIRVDGALSRLFQVDSDRQIAIDEAKATWDQRQSELLQTHQRQSADVTARRQAAFESKLEQWKAPVSEGGHVFLQEGYDEALQTAREIARMDSTGELSDEDRAEMHLTMGLLKKYGETLASQANEIDRLQKQNKKLRAAQPSTTGTTGLQSVQQAANDVMAGNPMLEQQFRSAIEAAQKADQQKNQGW